MHDEGIIIHRHLSRCQGRRFGRTATAALNILDRHCILQSATATVSIIAQINGSPDSFLIAEASTGRKQLRLSCARIAHRGSPYRSRTSWRRVLILPRCSQNKARPGGVDPGRAACDRRIVGGWESADLGYEVLGGENLVPLSLRATRRFKASSLIIPAATSHRRTRRVLALQPVPRATRHRRGNPGAWTRCAPALCRILNARYARLQRFAL